jgi:hypothetical protein
MVSHNVVENRLRVLENRALRRMFTPGEGNNRRLEKTA